MLFSIFYQKILVTLKVIVCKMEDRYEEIKMLGCVGLLLALTACQAGTETRLIVTK